MGEVTGGHLRDDCMVEGRFDPMRYHPVARMGQKYCALITEVFTLVRPSGG
jgi:hypothetical protein